MSLQIATPDPAPAERPVTATAPDLPAVDVVTRRRDPQLARMSEEVGHLLRNAADRSAPGGELRELRELRRRLADEMAWWGTLGGDRLLEAARRSFRTRQLLVASASYHGGSWRNSLSYIGDREPGDIEICTHSYERSEVDVPRTSPLFRPFPWVTGHRPDATLLYANSGMAAIGSWLFALRAIAAERQQRYVLVTNALYHETARLLGLARLHPLEVRRVAGADELVAAIEQADGPVAAYVDSSHRGGGAETVRRALQVADPERVVAVTWDSSCVPAADSPLGAGLAAGDLTTPLIVVRSHAKLDQLGLELCSLGSVTALMPAKASDEPRARAERLAFLIESLMELTGAFPSAANLRLMAHVGLPAPVLTQRANRYLRQANELAGRILADELRPHRRLLVEEYEHACFVNIHFLDLPPVSENELIADMRAIEAMAARRGLPVWRSDSFGFHYTALTCFKSPEWSNLGHPPHSVLRVCFGGHDPDVTDAVARLIAHQLVRHRS